MDQLRSDHNDKKNVPVTILENAYEQAISAAGAPFVKDATIQERIALVARGKGNKSCVRALLACALAKIDRPEIDIRKPYTKIKARNSYSGRDYDERYVHPFVSKHNLPVNSTTAFLTPAFRNRNITLTPRIDLVGRPPEIYGAFLALLDDVHQGRISAEQLLVETVRNLVLEGNKNTSRLTELLATIQRNSPRNELAAEAILLLVEHHLGMGSSSRLPVLIVAAAYTAAKRNLGERVLPLESHNAADKQTGSLGDLQVALLDDSNIVTAYEMKTRPVTIGDVDIAVNKILQAPQLDNYIFITTERIDPGVSDYAAKLYTKTGGIEITVLDCVGFLRHFLYLFYRLRTTFLNTYQELVLAEPNSAVGPHLKEALLLLRAAAERANIHG